MKILGISIIERRRGSDVVSLRTDLPGAIYPFTEALCLEFRCAKSTGVRYVVKHFPDVIIEHVTKEQQ